MASGPSFMDFCDSFTGPVAADLIQEPHRLRDLGFSSFEAESPFHDHGPPLSPHASLFSTDELLHGFFLGTWSETPLTPAAPQTPHEASISHPRTTIKPPHNVPSAASNGKVTEAGRQFTGLTQSSSNVLSILPLTQPIPFSPTVAALPPNWVKIPQRNYDYGKKQRGFEQLKPIFFSVNGRPGVNLGDAFRKSFTGLDGRDDPVLQDAAGAISCRLLFPGYPVNSNSCQIHVLDWTKNRQPITRSKLAHEVAKKLKKYLTNIAKITLDKSVEGRWKVGEGSMDIDNMFLVSFVSVSRGSFQPEIWVADPSVPQVPAGWE